MERSDCQKCQVLLDEQWDGTVLGEQDAQFVKQHLGACLPCASLAHDLGKVLVAAEELREVSYERPIEVAPLVLRPRPALPWLRAMLAGAAVAATVLLGFQWGLRSQSADKVANANATTLVRMVVPMANAQSVSVLGDFTGWQKKIPLERTESGLWVGELRVPAGRYRYVLVVDDNQMQPDPAAPQVVDDGFGGKNSVLSVDGTL